MKRKMLTGIAIALTGLLLLSGSQIYKAQANTGGDHGCALATLNGSYGFYGTGITSDGPYAAVGTLTFDGKGNCLRQQSVSRNGAFERNHLAFQYSVAGNCTGEALFEGHGFETIVIADGGKEIYLIKEGEQTVTLVGKKIHP